MLQVTETGLNERNGRKEWTNSLVDLISDQRIQCQWSNLGNRGILLKKKSQNTFIEIHKNLFHEMKIKNKEIPKPKKD